MYPPGQPVFESFQGEWWLRDAETASVRDHFRVEDEDGGRFWLFRLRGPVETRWFIQGVFA